LLGHAELSTTEIYTQVSIQKLKAVHTATHPARLEQPSKMRAQKPCYRTKISKIFVSYCGPI
jgi:hypothetical protein